MESLTKREEDVMHILWGIKRGVVRDIIDRMEAPRPPYNTISSIVRILERKGFVGHKAYGKTHEYFSIVSKLAYRKLIFKNMLKNYFEGSYENVVSFLVNNKEMSDEEIMEIKDIIDNAEK